MNDDHVFTQRFTSGASTDAGPLAGVDVSIKDLLDVEGYPTRAGSDALHDAPPAARDAVVVARLRAAGARFVGHTTMTELAYSGLGLNAAGTPDNPRWPGHIPGGSTSGGAASVALGIAHIAIGTDTGGSLRIPAAFCGLVGFKPTRSSVPREGCVPLAPSLDSIGPIATCVSDCELAWRIMADRAGPANTAGRAGAPSSDGPPAAPSPLARLIVPTNFATADLDPEVAAAFERGCAALHDTGIEIEHRNMPSLETYSRHAVWHYAAVESRAVHASLWAERRNRLDPRIRRRMARADEVAAIEYARTLIEREALIEAFAHDLGDALLAMPTVAILPPRPEPLDDDDTFDAVNLLALRHTSLANIMDGCSISLPIGASGPPVGFMLVAPHGADERLLAAAHRLAPTLSA